MRGIFYCKDHPFSCYLGEMRYITDTKMRNIYTKDYNESDIEGGGSSFCVTYYFCKEK